MKFILFILICFCSILGSLFLVSLTPFHFYKIAVNEGVKSNLLDLKPRNNRLLKGKNLTLVKREESNFEKNVWKNFHFKNIIMPFPIEHPVLTTLPILEARKNGSRLGAIYLNRKKKSLVKFKFYNSRPFKKYNIYQKLFKLPFFKNRLRLISQKKLWQDLFLLKIKKEYKRDYSVDTFFSMIYDLYILNLREKTFEKKMRNFYFIKEKSIAIIQLESTEKNWSHELIYLLKDGVIHSYSLKTLYKEDTAKGIRERIIKTLSYKESTPSAAKLLYSRFRSLPYKKRIEPSGIVYLFVAFGHVSSEEKFLQMMITLLERGKGNAFYLTPLYHYASKKFGTNFSRKDDIRSENAKRNLERKIKEELEKEINQSVKDFVSVEGEFDNPNDRKKYYLKKAKEELLENKNIDEENMLIEN